MRINHRGLILNVTWVLLMAIVFAEVEIQIEGGAGWATSLPTWRIESHWLLDIFWGGRAMTGYHAWMFPFIAMVFHLPLFFLQSWNWKLQSRVLACIMEFWIVEDFLWFILNPAFGWQRFNPVNVFWHKHWLWGAPLDYWTFSVVACLLFVWSYHVSNRDLKLQA